MNAQGNNPGKCAKVGWRLTTTIAPLTVITTSEETGAPSIANQTSSATLEPHGVTDLSTNDPSEEPPEYATSTPSGSANETSSSLTLPYPNRNISSSSAPADTTSESVTDQTGAATTGPDHQSTKTTKGNHHGSHTGETYATEIPTDVTSGEVSPSEETSSHTKKPGEVTGKVSGATRPTTPKLDENSSVVIPG